MALDVYLVVLAVVALVCGAGAYLWVQVGWTRQEHGRTHEAWLEGIRSQMRYDRWAMEAEARARWVREWSLLTMDPPPGQAAPDAPPGRQAGSNTYLHPALGVLGGERIGGGWEMYKAFPFQPKATSTPPSTPSPSPRRIGRRPEEMRLSRWLEDAGSRASAR